VLVAYALHSAELYLARLWLPLLLGALLVRAGAPFETATARAGALAGLMFSAGVAGVFLGGALSDRVGRTAAAAALFAASGACSFAIGWIFDGSFGVVTALGFLYGFFTSADSSIYATAVTELSPIATLGSALGLQSFAGFLAGAIAPVVAGVLLDTVAGDAAWTLTFGFNGLLAVVGVLVLMTLRRAPRAREMALGRR
jgi:MFS family permease